MTPSFILLVLSSSPHRIDTFIHLHSHTFFFSSKNRHLHSSFLYFLLLLTESTPSFILLVLSSSPHRIDTFIHPSCTFFFSSQNRHLHSSFLYFLLLLTELTPSFILLVLSSSPHRIDTFIHPSCTFFFSSQNRHLHSSSLYFLLLLTESTPSFIFVLILSSSPHRIDSDGGRSTLHVARAETSDSSWFTCQAVNIAGTASTRAKLLVQGKSIIYCNLSYTLHCPISAYIPVCCII